MLGWAKERWVTISEAAGVRKYVIGVIIATILGAVDWIEKWAQKLFAKWLALETQVGDLEMVFGFPSWIVGLTVLFALLWWWMLEYAVKLRRELAPKLSLRFEPEAGCVVVTPVKYRNRNGEVTHESRAVSIRGLVVATSKKAVRQCTVYVTDVKKKDISSGNFINTVFIDDLQLPWALIPTPEIEIPKGIRRYFGILMVKENTDQLKWTDNVVYSLRHRDLFKDHTTYRLKLAVVGDGITEEIIIEVKWSGHWDQVEACQVVST